MAHWNSCVAGNIKAIQHSGMYDPTEIVGEGNLLPTGDNGMAYTGIPGTAPDDKGDAEIRADGMVESGGIPSTKPGGGDPHAGKGSF